MSADGAPSKVVEMKAPEAVPPRPAPVPPEATKKPASRWRYIVMAAVPVVLIAAGLYLWLSGGRYSSTDNAYVQQDRVTVSSDIAGRIIEAPVRENDAVAAGSLLFRIDPEPYRIALAGAEAALASARLQVEGFRATYEQALAAEKAASENRDFRQKAFERQQGLLGKGVSSQASFDEAENDLRSAEQTLSQASQNVIGARAAMGGDPNIETDKHPAVLAALARRDQAALDLKHTEVMAPAAGVVAQADRLLVGQYVNAATAILSLVETQRSWVEANFKETDLGKMSVGEKATISIDAYPGHTFNGVVASIGAGTGAEFSVLPAQNATGNWIKVVQRVPVRIRFTDATDGVPLRTGLSAWVEVDTESAPAK